MTRRLWTSLLSAIGLIMLILDAKTALLGASEGITLCIQTVIPSLLPFFVLSILLTSSVSGTSFRILKPIAKLCGIPNGSQSAFLVGILGGYPTGAHSVAQAYEAGAITKQEAIRMLPFCNLAGPAFLFGIVSGKFTNPHISWILWEIHIASALFVGMVLPGKSGRITKVKLSQTVSVTQALQKSIRIMASVCGWIVVFRIMIAFLNRWILWLFPAWVQVAVAGILELSNGCCDLGRIPSEGLRMVLASGLLAFGGICVTMQTASVTGHLPLGTYFCGKLLQCLFSLLLSGIVQMLLLPEAEHMDFSPFFTLGICLIIAGSVKILHKKKNNSSIFEPVGV